ncbi:MAG: hypothetical protein LBO78_03140 [Rickettsiales bacterium]|jgi:hypothetical protein|nr:hypothetical protein [Rickettsiales bacterium]
MLYTEDYYRDLIAKLGLPEMPIAKVAFRGKSREAAKKFRAGFANISKKILQFAYYNNIKDLVDADFDRDAIMGLSRGETPENIDIYLKAPAEYGGSLEFSNMFLIKKYPFKAILDRFVDEQVMAFSREHGGSSRDTGFVMPSELFVPNPKGIIFIPALKGITGAGGNSSTDRMTEIGSTLFLKQGDRL